MMKSNCGAVLSEWRAIRRMSQLDLALTTDISQKHISFVELGRTNPSRDMVLKLASGLELPLRARNELLAAAGYAPVYLERRLDLEEMRSAREALELILRHHDPNPAIVTDASWNIVMQNAAAARIISACIDPEALRELSSGGGLNFIRMMFAPNGLRPCILNWTTTRGALISRLRREAVANPGSPSDRLRRELDAAEEPSIELAAGKAEQLDPVLPLELLLRNTHLRLFNTFTTFGTPQDITLQELRIDMSFPADEPTRRFLVGLAEGAMPAPSIVSGDVGA